MTRAVVLTVDDDSDLLALIAKVLSADSNGSKTSGAKYCRRRSRSPFS